MCAGQVSGRGPGFPIVPRLPSRFTGLHLTGLRLDVSPCIGFSPRLKLAMTVFREVFYDPKIQTLVSNPVRELIGLRNGTLARFQSTLDRAPMPLTLAVSHVATRTCLCPLASPTSCRARTSLLMPRPLTSSSK